jgi:hypothetical protein
MDTVRGYYLPANIIRSDMVSLERQARKMIDTIWSKCDGWWLDRLAEGTGNGETAGKVICAIGDLRELIRTEFPEYFRLHIELEN